MQSDVLLEFQVKILTLGFGRYTYTLQITDAFFEAFEHSIVQKGSLVASILLEKSENLIRVTFDLDGTIELESDRSLDTFDHPISVSHQLIYKFGDEAKELSEEMLQIAWDTPALDLSQPIYEFITLAVPMRKLTPDEEQEPEGAISDDERLLVYRSTPVEPEGEEEPAPDPKWEALRKLFPN